MTTIWGVCRECKWWQVKPNHPTNNSTVGECIEEALLPFVLRVSGGSGCNRFIPNRSGVAESKQAPPPSPPSR